MRFIVRGSPEEAKPSARRDAPSRRSAGRPTLKQGERRQTELLDRALDMFLDRGFELTTMEAIATSLRMTKRTIYVHYGDKATLFKAAVEQAVQRWAVPRETLRALETSDLETTLVAVTRRLVASGATPEGIKLSRILNSESYRFPNFVTAVYIQNVMQYADFLIDLFARHQAAGAISVGQLRNAAFAFLSMAVGGPLHSYQMGGLRTAEQLDEFIVFSVDLFLNGVRIRTKTGPK
jgi:TetR/AcrR family transcriptional regulator, mexJK operon transcriptional repressor